jgi:hypothetical protein
LDRRLGEPPEHVCTMWGSENSRICGNLNSNPSVVQPVTSRYTDRSVLALLVASANVVGMMKSRRKRYTEYEGDKCTHTLW